MLTILLLERLALLIDLDEGRALLLLASVNETALQVDYVNEALVTAMGSTRSLGLVLVDYLSTTGLCPVFANSSDD